MHRDVKPGNVLLAEDGTARISDFGIAHAMGDVTLTSTGMVTGTPAYLAPEVARGEESGYAADVFSLGATLYTALEGRTPFGTDGNPMALLHRVASGVVEPPQHSGALAPLLTRDDALGPAGPADHGRGGRRASPPAVHRGERTRRPAATIATTATQARPCPCRCDADEEQLGLRLRPPPTTAPAGRSGRTGDRVAPWLVSIALVLVALLAFVLAAQPGTVDAAGESARRACRRLASRTVVLATLVGAHLGTRPRPRGAVLGHPRGAVLGDHPSADHARARPLRPRRRRRPSTTPPLPPRRPRPTWPAPSTATTG